MLRACDFHTPLKEPYWADFLFCPYCNEEFDLHFSQPFTLVCGHTFCKFCCKMIMKDLQCPIDRTFTLYLTKNRAILILISDGKYEEEEEEEVPYPPEWTAKDRDCYKKCDEYMVKLALHLRPFVKDLESPISSTMQRMLVTLINCQLIEETSRMRAFRVARSLGEQAVTDLILQHQNPQQLNSDLLASVRSLGCDFLGPDKQEEVLRLVLLALDDNSALSRKILVLFINQRCDTISKRSIGHVVQLLYRAGCFKLSKREWNSTLMQLKEEFRSYHALRHVHDAHIVQIAAEAGLRMEPDQWSIFLYGNTSNEWRMRSIIDTIQVPPSLSQSIQELVIVLQRTGDPTNLKSLRTHLNVLDSFKNPVPTWEELLKALEAVQKVISGLVKFMQHHGNRKLPNSVGSLPNTKYKTSLCKNVIMGRSCPHGTSCTFAHSEEELKRYRAKSRKTAIGSNQFLEGFEPHKSFSKNNAAPAVMHSSKKNDIPIPTVTHPSIRNKTSASHRKPNRKKTSAGASSTSSKRVFDTDRDGSDSGYVGDSDSLSPPIDVRHLQISSLKNRVVNISAGQTSDDEPCVSSSASTKNVEGFKKEFREILKALGNLTQMFALEEEGKTLEKLVKEINHDKKLTNAENIESEKNKSTDN